ncbi:Brp/Blh family beta-carotene 15,15'-dioxygenase [Flavobacterium sp. J49]|uniref:Brp/Blh family beta-carotene 15,15'-dioxygenase n=1 Tax=Flavobacterium sp. J49 TaxID=2718534 RepID=UPI0015935478|nr:Brp/Blh family beta-carotene 15,15'-dioxygenase [Flavobacterium sp. J49]MBF6642037.1 Brp/Blh family beta-carotene 15,15'-dioxygenase [Flavobacterium sp. J49]NIC03285.1 beta-carotene 15,15'-dioxygenase, Brp/Blh family [Flavobacterium sp. J49]
MTNSNNFGIVLSFFGLWITTYFSIEYQQIIGFAIIFLFGILHGSNDLQLISKINNDSSATIGKKILTYYIAFVLSGIVLFYSLPKIALLLFILISAYHFGEQHWNKLSTKKTLSVEVVFQTLYGLFILFLLFYFHQGEVNKIMEQIIKESIQFVNYTNCLFVIGVLLLVSSFVLFKNNSNFRSEILANIVYLILFGILFRNSNLIWAFAIYFVVWHSLPSIKEQIVFLYGQYSLKNFMRYFKAAFGYWLFSLIGIMLLYIFFKDQEIFKALFFSFLAAITFPHTLVIMKMPNTAKDEGKVLK